jgi:hypothetical protein
MVSEAVGGINCRANPMINGTMDSATLEQQSPSHYKRPYLRLANSLAESIDSLPGQQLLEQEKTGVIIVKV